MIFEGFEINYAHVKLIPIHEKPQDSEDVPVTDSVSQTEYTDRYQGFVTSQLGPVSQDLAGLAGVALSLRQALHDDPITAPRSWRVPADHTLSVLEEPWYKALMSIQDMLFHSSVEYFSKNLHYKYALVPATTDAVSSPMGLGSDSVPVTISLLGQDTHLADSMQFALEYFLRIEDGLPGVYYINTSFRGEDSDAMHLNQFYHVECELLGGFEDGVTVAEDYILYVIRKLLREHEESIVMVAGSVKHLKALLDLYSSNKGHFPRITLDKALELFGMDGSTWQYVVPSDPGKGRAITRTGELKLIEYFGGAVWLTEPDHISVPFYQAYANRAGTKARCADLLLGNGEVLGLGERHVHAQEVTTALNRHELLAEPYSWYLNIRKVKPVLTTGWGMGVERFLAWVFQHDDIRDLTIIPRIKGHSFAP